MRKLTHVVASLTVVATAGVAIAAAPASAAPTGVGGTVTKTTVLNVALGQAGSLLNLSVLGDVGNASIDPHTGTPSANTSLNPLSVASQVLHLNASVPPLTTQAPGGQSDAAGQAISLSSLGVPAALATGTLKAAALHSDFASSAAHSAMTAAEVDKLSLVGGGLLSIDLLSSTLGANALTSDADGARTVNIGNISILDLGVLLRGLGIDPATLPIPTVSALLKQLGAAVPGLPTGVDLSTLVDQLNSSITSLRATINPALNQVTGAIDSTTSGILGKVGVTAPSTGSTVAQVNGVVDQVQAKLVALLTSGLSALDSLPLVQVAATSVGITTKAADTVANSAAGITTAPLNIKVAGIALPAIDASAVAATVNGLLASANTALNGLLSTLNLPANLVSISVLDQAKSVTTNGSYTQAVAGITGLTAKIAPIDPAAVLAAVSKLTGATIGSELGTALAAVPLPMGTAMSTVASLLQTAAPLTGGALVQIASVSGASTFTVAAAPVAPGTPVVSNPSVPLPHTGGRPELAMLGVLFGGLSLAVVRWRRRPEVRPAAVARD